MGQKVQDAYYSEEGATKNGWGVWCGVGGGEVNVTEVVAEGRKPLSRFPDLVYVGKVTRWVRSHMKDVWGEVGHKEFV